MKLISKVCYIFLFLAVANVFAAPMYIPAKERSKTKRVSIKISQSSKKTNGKPPGIHREVPMQMIKLDITMDNRNSEDTTVSYNIFYIGKNKRGFYKLLNTHSNSVELKARKSKVKVETVIEEFREIIELKKLKRHEVGYYRNLPEVKFEYRGYLLILKGADDKIISVDGEFEKLYKMIPEKISGDVFNSKGEKVSDWDK